jgi:myo-inositol-1(or 4)-monophosphatase
MPRGNGLLRSRGLSASRTTPIRRTTTTASSEALLALALEAAQAAGRLLLTELETGPTGLTWKTSRADIVCDVDHAAEALIVETIAAARPDDAILAEESGERPGTSGVRWVVDPLDGSTNYAYGRPCFAVSVAAEIDGEVVAGVVVDPSRQETFTAVRGGGATCNGRRLAVAGAEELALALVGTGLSPDPARRAEQAALLSRISACALDVRHSGSAAVDLCSVAAGRLDLYYESDLRHWDRAAGALVATEAGASVVGLDGGPATDAMTIAGAPRLVEELAQALAGAL